MNNDFEYFPSVTGEGTVNMCGGSSDGGKGESSSGSFKFYGRNSYELETIRKEIRERIDQLREIQRDLDKIKASFHNERAKLEASFLNSCEPLYRERYYIVNGVVKDTGVTTDAEYQEGGVPNFWLYALKGSGALYEEITEQDEGALKHLTDIKWSRIQKGFRLEFHFSTNPFFENSVLTKTYHMTDEDGSFIKCAIGTEITWRPGKCFTQKLAKQSGKRSNKANPTTVKSFFSFFSPPNIPNNLEDKEDSREILKLRFHVEKDYILGLVIRDDIIPPAFSRFTGEAAGEEKTEISAQHSKFLDNLSKNVRERVESLRPIQGKYDALKSKFDKDRASIQATYLESCQPLYLRRYDIINEGENTDPKADEVGSDSDDEAFIDDKGVPNFWLYALQNNDYIENEITYRDEQALKYLKDIKSSPIEESKGFKLEFYFKANPFFKNYVLTKAYHITDEDICVVEDIKGTEIEWYPTRCLAQMPIRKKPKMGSKDARAITTIVDCDSFFSFFSELETSERTPALVEHDIRIGSIIRDKIIPHAVSWYTGEAIDIDDLKDDDEQYLGFEAEYDDDDEDGDEEYEDLYDGLSSDGYDSESEEYDEEYNYY